MDRLDSLVLGRRRGVDTECNDNELVDRDDVLGRQVGVDRRDRCRLFVEGVVEVVEVVEGWCGKSSEGDLVVVLVDAFRGWAVLEVGDGRCRLGCF